MIAELTTVRDMPDGSKIKLVSQILTTGRGVGATIEYVASFFISPDGKYWSNIPSETGTLIIGAEVRLENERALWASLEPKQ